MTRLIRILISILFLSGCSKEAEIGDLQSFTANAFKDHVPVVDPLPPLKPHAVFIYTAPKKTDPFNAGNLRKNKAAATQGGGLDGPDPSRRKEPLESFQLDGLSLVGIMVIGGENWAIIRASDQTVHRITSGNYLGKNHGKVLDISNNQVSIQELVKNPVGKWENRSAKLVLK